MKGPMTIALVATLAACAGEAAPQAQAITLECLDGYVRCRGSASPVTADVESDCLLGYMDCSADAAAVGEVSR